MEFSFLRVVFIFLSLTIFLGTSLAEDNDNGYVQEACNSTLYPHLCYEYLSNYSSKIQSNPKTLATIALSITLSATWSSLESIKTLPLISKYLKPIEVEALSDCIEVLKNSVSELKQSIEEIGQIGPNTDFKLQLSDIQTWVSAALTNEDTCMDGFSTTHKDVNLRAMVRHYVLKATQLTSIALALVNDYASS